MQRGNRTQSQLSGANGCSQGVGSSWAELVSDQRAVLYFPQETAVPRVAWGLRTFLFNEENILILIFFNIHFVSENASKKKKLA